MPRRSPVVRLPTPPRRLFAAIALSAASALAPAPARAQSTGAGNSKAGRNQLEAQKPPGNARPEVGTAKLPPPPKPGPLAAPASLDQVGAPRALDDKLVPRDNPQSPEKVALGEKLFFEPRLSADGTVACATCHDPVKGFTDQRPTSVGIKQQVGHRNAPTVLNALFNDVQFWDGRAATLEEQARLPVVNPIEMGEKTLDDAVAAIARDAEYVARFQKAFGRAPNGDDMARAIAAYERTQLAFDSPFDRFLAGDERALDAAARRGWTTFNGKGRCMSCHGVSSYQPTFTDNKFHNIGVAAHKPDFVDLAKKGLAALSRNDQDEIDRLALETDFAELGRFLVTKQPADIGAFKTPGLRNVVVTHPYFHDGSQETLWDVVDHYNKGGVQNPFLDGGIQRLGLTESEIDDLVAFMAALTSDRYKDLAKAELARQRALSRTTRPQRDTAAALGQKAKGPGLAGPFGDVAPAPGSKDPAQIGAF